MGSLPRVNPLHRCKSGSLGTSTRPMRRAGRKPGESMLFQFANVLVFILFSFGFVFALLAISKLLAPRNRGAAKLSTYECGEVPTGPAMVNRSRIVPAPGAKPLWMTSALIPTFGSTVTSRNERTSSIAATAFLP